jgi:hypothetical protein
MTTADTVVPQHAKPRKKKRVFLWFFLAVQALFLVWIISGAMAASGTSTDCANDTVLSTSTCNDAEDIGTGIGVFLVVVFWMMTDFLLAVIYGVYRLAKRNND